MLHISHTCCKHQVQPNACSSCFKQYFPFLPGGENPLPVLIVLLNLLPVLVALKILREILSFTRSFMINTLPLVGCLENSDRNVKQFRVIRGLLQLVLFTVSRYNILSECVWFCNVTPDLYRETVTQQTLLIFSNY